MGTLELLSAELLFIDSREFRSGLRLGQLNFMVYCTFPSHTIYQAYQALLRYQAFDQLIRSCARTVRLIKTLDLVNMNITQSNISC